VTAEQQKALLAVHPEAFATGESGPVLFVIREGKALAIPVVRGDKVGDLVAFTGEVRTGEKVVLKPSADLKTGKLVKVAQK
jgi:hypothetical protein